MKTRWLFLLLPLAALAVGVMNWAPGNSGKLSSAGGTNGTDGLAAAAAPAATETDAAQPANESRATPVVGASQANRGCEIVTHYLPRGDGTVQEAYSCESVIAATGHPYDSYSNAALESLAFADAKAAEILGMRISARDEAKAISLIIRAAALSGGDVAPILLYSQSYPQPSAVDGVPVRRTVHTQFVLAAVVDLLGAKSGLTATWEETIRHYSSDPDTEIALLHLQAVRIVEEMRQIQLDVLGHVTIGGQGDA